MQSGAAGAVRLGADSICAVQQVSRHSHSSVFFGSSINMRAGCQGCKFDASYELVDGGDSLPNPPGDDFLGSVASNYPRMHYSAHNQYGQSSLSLCGSP